MMKPQFLGLPFSQLTDKGNSMYEAQIANHLYEIKQTEARKLEQMVIANKLKALELSIKFGSMQHEMFLTKIQEEIDKIMNKH